MDEINRRNGVTSNESTARAPEETGRVGFLTTWNQRCGLATYARFLLDQCADRDFVVLAEETKEVIGRDEEYVLRCWRRRGAGKPNDHYVELETAIREHNIRLLHLNCHARFFEQPAFSGLLDRLRSNGVRIVGHLHNLFTVEGDLKSLLSSCDGVIVHTPENRLEAIANGAKAELVHVVPHGVHRTERSQSQTKAQARRNLGIRCTDEPLIATFGFVQPHKGIEGLLEAIVHLKARGVAARGLIIGEVRNDDPNSAEYLRALRELALRHGIADNIEFVSSYVPDDAVGDYFAASDLVLMNYRSQHFEASGACSLAVGAGAVVMCSLAPSMMPFGDAVWHMTAGYPPALSAELLLSNADLRAELQARARIYSEQNSWGVTAKRISEIYRTLGFQVGEKNRHRDLPEEESVVTTQYNTRPQAGLRVLVQNRSSTFTHRGGDTVVIEKLVDGLKARGCDVTVDVTPGVDPAGFDIVHLFNFATPDITRALAQRALERGVPYVVTTLYEDLPSFHNQSHAIANRLVDYVSRGQDRSWYESNPVDVSAVPRSNKFPNEWTAQNAQALFPNGMGEAKALRRDYPSTKNIVEVQLGHEIGTTSSADLFIREHGVRDFILCVGRIESRKNQLMLLKALEDSDLPVVLAAGGFSYQPDYERAVRSFVRKGKTLILGRLSPELLSSAYAACRVHVLPSWYELPGLVSLEAAAHGHNVVATRTGTSADYLRDKAYYCLPWDADSIYSAVMAAYYAPLTPGLQELARSYTWDRAIQTTLEAYERCCGKSSKPVQAYTDSVPARQSAVYDLSAEATQFQDILERGEMAAKNMDFLLAHDLLEQAERIDPTSVRALKARGAICLAESNVADARSYFDRALRLAPKDPKVLSGRGMCDMLSSEIQSALGYFKQALDISPDHLIALHQLVECSYRLSQFDDLHAALNRYLALKPDDNEMRFCLAGCLYKLGRMRDASSQVDRIIAVDPNHSAARDLKMQIENQAPVTRQSETAQAPSAAKPAVFGGSLQSSLEDLSKRITEWRVGGQSAQKETEVVVQAQTELPPVSIPMAGVSTTGTIATAEPYRPVRSSLFESRLYEIEDLKREKCFKEAAAKLEQLLTEPGLAGEDLIKAKVLEAELMIMEGDLVGADMMYDLVLKESPEYPRALAGKGALAADDERWSDAENFFARALKREPDYDVALAGKGLCEMAAGRNEPAFELFHRAARRNPENTRAILGVLQLGYPLKRYAQIEATIRSYLEVHPASIDMLYSLAGVLFAQKRLRDAQSELEKILIFEPENSRATELMRLIDQDGQGSAAV